MRKDRKRANPLNVRSLAPSVTEVHFGINQNSFPSLLPEFNVRPSRPAGAPPAIGVF